MIEVIAGKFKIKGIYWIHDPIIAKGAPHYRVCISVDGGISLACCTTGRDRQIQRLKLTKQHEGTLVQIDHLTSGNELIEPTFINCDTVHHYTENQLLRLEPPKITFKGNITDQEYKQILKGYLLSDLVSTIFQAECNNILNPE